jgi:hypothetical protein
MDVGSASGGHAKMMPMKGSANTLKPYLSRTRRDIRGSDVASSGDERLDKSQGSTRLKKTSEYGDMGIEGNFHVDDDEDFSFSVDLGGPRFAALSSALRSAGSSKSTIYCIEEGLDESSRTT